ncbi:MAG: metabolite traffic protein EboE [Planctomycetota bacterium]|nr:metabolite traffic protein EboE [Planctomycetota bacterium]MDE0961464.1 metabolite traffic protein EboE [Planctomycetota bacterium]
MYISQGQQNQPLGYEMNAHPSATLRDFNAAIDDFVIPIRDRVCPGEPFAISPHIGQSLAGQLSRKGVAESVGDRLRDLDLHIYSVNAFPLKDFHAEVVKDQVYLPSWAHVARAKTTCLIADVLVRIVPEARHLTISTLGGGYRPAGNTPAILEKMAAGYLKVVAHLAQIEQKTGIHIALNAEPEPDTTFECAEDVIAFWKEYLKPELPVLARALQCHRSRAEGLLRRHWTVNLDACHSAVLYRSPLEDWRRLDRAGILVGKTHITSAISLSNPSRSPAAYKELLQYIEPRYLHQSAARMKDGSIIRMNDLARIQDHDLTSIEEIRTHFHVPVSSARHGKLETTRDDAKALLTEALRRKEPAPHIAVETYTWPLLTKGVKQAEQRKRLIDGIAAELRWARREAGC